MYSHHQIYVYKYRFEDMERRIGRAFAYPSRADDSVYLWLGGGFLLLLSFLILPLLIVFGYQVRVIRESIDGDSVPPPLDDWNSLLINGIGASVITISYSVVPWLIGRVSVGPLGYVLWAVFMYIGTAGLTNYAYEGSVEAGFDARRIREVVGSVDFFARYLIAWLPLLAVLVVALIPFVGFLVSPFALFYAFVITGRLYADGFVLATGGKPSEPVDTHVHPQ